MITHELVELRGEYLRGARVHITVRDGFIIRCREIRCSWSGTRKFDRWFRELYSPVTVQVKEAYLEIKAADVKLAA